MNKDRIIVVYTTTSNQDEANHIANQLLNENLAACVQVSGPIDSCYRWQGKIKATREWHLSIKSAKAKWHELSARIKQLHSYDEPQIIAILEHDASDGYRKWVCEQVAGD
jgi:periplasmic divalent cation tolerance protein